MSFMPIVGLAMCLILVGSAVLSRRRRGEPIGRHALIWGALFAVAFLVAALIDHHGVS